MSHSTFGSLNIPKPSWSLSFESPIRILTAHDVDQVRKLLEAAEQESHAGFWVAMMMSYEAAPAFDRALKTHAADSFPLAWAAVYEQSSAMDEVSINGPSPLSNWEARITRTDYLETVRKIQQLIARGETYQVNYTFPLATTFKGDSREWYDKLCLGQAAQYSAYLDLGRYQVLSLSPELFFERKGNRIRTKPMKGTIRRGRWNAEDRELASTLAGSSKDQAENVMIVDLLRNDLGKVSETGSVKVSNVFALERLETLWQMTSQVESTLRPNTSLDEIFAAIFPCGSITGAPKIRTMEIIRELEPFPRRLYTGTIGFLAPGGDCTFNVAIRTVVVDSKSGEATYGVGGGITIDSTAEHEFEECLLKSSFLNATHRKFELLETLLLDDGEFFLLNRHVERMKNSAEYFDFSYCDESIFNELNRIAKAHSRGRWKTRLLLSKDGQVSCSAVALENPAEEKPLRVALAAKPVMSTDRFLFHKTTNRQVYEDALAARPDCDDVILWNERGEITESTIANVVISLDEMLLTPPQKSGLLAGTFRAEMLAEGKIQERVICVEELKAASELFLINSVRKWQRAILVEPLRM